MADKSAIVEQLLNPGIIAIIRTSSADDLMPAIDALLDGGLRAVEVTMTTPGALQSIQRAAKQFSARAAIGAGTVTSAAMAKQVIEHGASFIVTPVFKGEIIRVCNERSAPICCGAFTPTEAFNAHEAGADMIKIFPADSVGPAYIKAILAPLPHLKLVPTGGVTPENVADFFKAGSAAVGVGGNLVNSTILKQRDWQKLKEQAARYVENAGRGA